MRGGRPLRRPHHHRGWRLVCVSERWPSICVVTWSFDATVNEGEAARPAGVVANRLGAPNVVNSPDRPRIETIRLTDARRTHILDGDRWGGGHAHGTGVPGKTEFPETWSRERINSTVLDVARDPDKVEQQDNGRWFTQGAREDVTVTVIVQPDGQVWTAWPVRGGPGVRWNPRRSRQP
ncbi:MAG: hypothetical protein GEU96_05700 [Propionibacteriales bacterium]|nr:hypothetical protein [Propionibacteriales bacterium]